MGLDPYRRHVGVRRCGRLRKIPWCAQVTGSSGDEGVEFLLLDPEGRRIASRWQEAIEALRSGATSVPRSLSIMVDKRPAGADLSRPLRSMAAPAMLVVRHVNS